MDPIAVEGGTLYSMLKGKESAAGKKIVSYRVKYPLTFNADSTKIATWGYSKISQFSIEEATNLIFHILRLTQDHIKIGRINIRSIRLVFCDLESSMEQGDFNAPP